VGLIAAEICRDPKQRVAWTINKVETSLTLKFFKPDCELEDDDLALGDRVFCAPIAETSCSTLLQYGCLVLKQLDINVYQRVGFCILGQGQMFSEFHFSDRRLRDQQNSTVFNLEDYRLPDRNKARVKII
jgi:hypothetical protein